VVGAYSERSTVTLALVALFQLLKWINLCPRNFHELSWFSISSSFWTIMWTFTKCQFSDFKLTMNFHVNSLETSLLLSGATLASLHVDLLSSHSTHISLVEMKSPKVIYFLRLIMKFIYLNLLINRSSFSLPLGYLGLPTLWSGLDESNHNNKIYYQALERGKALKGGEKKRREIQVKKHEKHRR